MELARLFVEKGANVNAADQEGKTALMLAIGATVAGATPAAAETTSTSAATHIAVTLTEMAVELSVSTVPAGAVVFDITNKGSAEHEFVVLKTDYIRHVIDIYHI